jgi:hypothetical protein
MGGCYIIAIELLWWTSPAMQSGLLCKVDFNVVAIGCFYQTMTNPNINCDIAIPVIDPRMS